MHPPSTRPRPLGTTSPARRGTSGLPAPVACERVLDRPRFDVDRDSLLRAISPRESTSRPACHDPRAIGCSRSGRGARGGLLHLFREEPRDERESAGSRNASPARSHATSGRGRRENEVRAAGEGGTTRDERRAAPRSRHRVSIQDLDPPVVLRSTPTGLVASRQVRLPRERRSRGSARTTPPLPRGAPRRAPRCRTTSPLPRVATRRLGECRKSQRLSRESPRDDWESAGSRNASPARSHATSGGAPNTPHLSREERSDERERSGRDRRSRPG